MTIVNTETIPGKTVVAVKGLVQGNTVRAKNIGRDIAAGFKNMVGGELKGYTELLTAAVDLEKKKAYANRVGQDLETFFGKLFALRSEDTQGNGK